MADDLEAVVPQKAVVSVTIEDDLGNKSTEDVTIRQVRMKELTDLIKIAAPILPLMKDPKKFDAMTAYMEYPDAVMELLALCCKRPKEWVWALEVPDAVNLFSKLLEVNLDFFIRSILPSIYRAARQIKNVSAVQEALAGQTTSTS